MSTTQTRLPDWWQREKLRRQTHLLVLLVLMLALIAFFYYLSIAGRTGVLGGINFDTSNTIAFVRQDSTGKTTIYDIHADGTGLLPLTDPHDTSDKSGPAWTIDGKQLLYASNRDDRQRMQIYIRGASDTKQATWGTGRKESPLADPDGKHFAFLAMGAVKEAYLNASEFDQILPPPRAGGNESADAPNPGEQPDINGPYLSAVYSADGTGIAGVQELSTENNFTADPFLLGLVDGDQVGMALPSGATKAIPVARGNTVSLAWEPNGKRLMAAFAESPETHAEGNQVETAIVSGVSVFSFDNPAHPDVKRLMICIGNTITPHNVAWSPDGSKIAFEAWELKGEKTRVLRGIVVMPLPDQTVTLRPQDMPRFQATLPVTTQSGPHAPWAGQPRMPRWSPDGSRLLFQVTRPDNKNDLCVINADLTNPINLTHGQGDNTQGAWSPARPK